MDVAVDRRLLQPRGLLHELPVLAGGAKSHDVFDDSAVVPGPIEQHDLSRRGKLTEVALEVPLRALSLVWFLQRHYPRPARVQMLGEAFDGATLTRRVTAFKEHHDPLPAVLDPRLHLQQLDLYGPLGVLVL